VLSHLFPVAQTPHSVLALLFFVPGERGSLVVLYPMTSWLAMMVLGWAFGRHLLAHSGSDAGRQQSEKLLLLSGLSALLFWAYLRSNNGYGNMFLLRDDTTIMQWLHMSKYPPSLAFSCMELGLMALCLVVFMRHERRMKGEPSPWNPLLVFGQTALFFYMIHFVLLAAAAIAFTGGTQLRGLHETYLAALGVCVVLYPACLGYRALKRNHPKSVLQYF
jgi:uncharacterized membrane protein